MAQVRPVVKKAVDKSIDKSDEGVVAARVGYRKAEQTVDLSPSSWHYINDGNANIVFGYTPRDLDEIKCGTSPGSTVKKGGTCKKWIPLVMRMRKVFLHASSEDKLSEMCREYKWSHDYADLIIRRLIGSEYVDTCELISLPRSSGLQLCRQASSLRPPHRIGEEGLPAKINAEKDWNFYASIGRNLLSPHPLSASSNALCIELKPKWGYIPTHRHFPASVSGLNKEKSRKLVEGTCQFCLLQTEKVLRRKVQRISRYCPLDLYSEDSRRVDRAVRGLIETPQNNLQLFYIPFGNTKAPESTELAGSGQSHQLPYRVAIQDPKSLAESVSKVAKPAEKMFEDDGIDREVWAKNWLKTALIRTIEHPRCRFLLQRLALGQSLFDHPQGAPGISREFEAALKEEGGDMDALRSRVRELEMQKEWRESIISEFSKHLGEQRGHKVASCSSYADRVDMGRERRNIPLMPPTISSSANINTPRNKTQSLSSLSRYLLSRTLKDVSIMMVLTPKEAETTRNGTEKDGDLSDPAAAEDSKEKRAGEADMEVASVAKPSPSATINVQGRQYFLQISLVDLDRKAVQKIPKYRMIERSAIEAFLHARVVGTEGK